MAAVIVLLSSILGASPLILDEFTLDSFEREMNASADVIEGEGNLSEVGVNPDPNLYFGEVDNRARIRKFLNLTAPGVAEVRISSEGNISEYLEYDRRLYFEDSERVTLKLVPDEPGYYEGKVFMDIRTPSNSVGRRWLELKRGYWNLLKRVKNSINLG